MATLTVSNGEHFTKGKVRYSVYALVVLGLSVVSFCFDNRSGAVLILVFWGGYLYFSFKTRKEVTLKIEKGWLSIDGHLRPWKEYSAFTLEYHTKSQKIHNLIFFMSKTHAIYTIQDSEKRLEKFIKQLLEHLPIKEDFQQTIWEQLVRRLKL